MQIALKVQGKIWLLNAYHALGNQINSLSFQRHQTTALNKFSASHEPVKESVISQTNYRFKGIKCLFEQIWKYTGNLLTLLLLFFYDVWVYLDRRITASIIYEDFNLS